MRKGSDSRSALNRKSRNNAVGVDDLDWSLEADLTKYPEHDSSDRESREI